MGPKKNTPETNGSAAAADGKRKKRVSRRRTGRLAALAVLLLIPLLLFALTVSFRTGFPRPEMTPEDWLRQSRVTMKVMQQVLNRDGEELARIKLSPQEVGSLLRFAVNSDQLAALFGQRNTPGETVLWLGDYDDGGTFHLTYLLRGPGPLSFILRGSASGKYGNNRFALHPENCRIGRLPVPAWAIRPFLPRIFAELDKNAYVRFFHQTVESVEPDQAHNLIVTYRPDMARALPLGGF